MRNPFQSRSLTLLAIGFCLVLVSVSLLLFRFVRQPHFITLDGEEIIARGRYASVAEVIEAAEITLRPEDHVAPSLSSAPQDNGPITIFRAFPIALEIDDQRSTVWTHQTELTSFLAENDLGLVPTSRIVADGKEVEPGALTGVQLGRSLNISNQTEVFIREGQNVTSFQTDAHTVGQALIEAGVDIFSADNIEPPVDSWLQPGETISIERAAAVTVSVDGRSLDARTKYSTVAEALAEAGVGLVGRDGTAPALEETIGDGREIEVKRSKTEYQVSDSPLPFASRLQPLDTLDIDQRSLIAPGSAGVSSQLMRVETHGSEVYSPTLVGEWVSQPPVDEVIGYGTNIVERTVDTPDGPLTFWRVVRMRVTAYTAADAGRPPDHPAYGITASGRRAGFGIVAIDPNVVPFRSQVYVPGYGVAYAGDTGGGVKGRWIDLGYDDGQIQTWNGYVDVYYLTPVPEPDRINYLIPSVLP